MLEGNNEGEAKPMDSISKQMSRILNIPIVPEVTNKDWQMEDDGSVETAVGDFIYGLVRVIRPNYALETGCYHGVSSSYIGLALKENQWGFLDAIEYENQHLLTCKQRWQTLDINEYINEHLISSLEFEPQHSYDFIFLDTEPPQRFAELIRYYPYLNEGGYVLIHDLPRSMCQGNVNLDLPDFKSWPYGDISDQIKQWVKEDKLRVTHFPTPRGLTLFYKVHTGDHKW